MKDKNVTYKILFMAFLKAGLAFGGGLAVILEMEKEFVERRKIMTRSEFMTLFGISRIIPAGGVLVLCIGIGYKYKKIPGTLIALFANLFPGFILTVLLVALYGALREGEFIEVMNSSIMPAAVGLIVIAALNMGKDVMHSPLLMVFVAASFAATLFLGMSATLVLFVGAILGIIIFSNVKEGHDLRH